MNAEVLEQVNCIDEIAVASLHSNQVVPSGKTLAGCRVIPLVIQATKITKVESICRRAGAVCEVKALKPLRVGVVTTGSEVYLGRIEDRFGPVLRKKIAGYGSEVFRQILVPDDMERIVAAIHSLMSDGAEMILVSGGMSVDPDDLTPTSIRAAGGQVVVYGAPVLPGSMFMLAHVGQVPVLGLPGCVMYHKTTIFDLVLPRILAGEEVSRQDIARLGHGGLCTECETCRFPDCSFGKGT